MLVLKITLANRKNILRLKLVKLYLFRVADSESGIQFFLSRENFAVLPNSSGDIVLQSQKIIKNLQIFKILS